MRRLTYKVIKTEGQYNAYCNEMERLVMLKRKTREQHDTIELLTLLIENWDEQLGRLTASDPVELLRYLMAEHNLRSVDLARLLRTTPGLVSNILNYRKGLSKEIIRKLSAHFKVSQELFNRPYGLTSDLNSR